MSAQTKTPRWAEQPGRLRRFVRSPVSELGPTSVEHLFAWANSTRQSAVVNTIRVVPEGLSKFDSFPQDFNLFRASRGGISGGEAIVFVGHEIFIVTVSQNGFENVFAVTHSKRFSFTWNGRDSTR